MVISNIAPLLSIKDLCVKLETINGFLNVLDGFSLDVARGEIVAILGPSGCGKSTLIHAIAGFIPPTSGVILLEGEPVTQPTTDLGVVLQDLGLFFWKTVYENIAFGLVQQRIPKEERDKQVNRLLLRVKLEAFARFYPSQLSGGMAQRVALARALAPNPKVLLLDEPFGALDAQTRWEMQKLLLDLHSQDRMTIIVVTHDVDEALFLADRVVIMSARPATLRMAFSPNLSRPRSFATLTEEQFVLSKREAIEVLREEVLCASTQDRMAKVAATHHMALSVGLVPTVEALPLFRMFDDPIKPLSFQLEAFDFESGAALLRILERGFLDVALVGAAPAIAALHQGSHLRIIRDGGYWTRAQTGGGLVVLPELADASLEIIAQHSIAINGRGSQAHYLCQAVFLDISSEQNYIFMPPDQIVEHLRLGKFKVAALYGFHLQQALQIHGVVMKFNFLDLNDPLQSQVLVAADHIVKSRPSLINSLQTAWDDTIEAIKCLPDLPHDLKNAALRFPDIHNIAKSTFQIVNLPVWDLDVSLPRLAALDSLLCRLNPSWEPLSLSDYIGIDKE